jgi:REP element-mobilizing transposase RayT
VLECPTQIQSVDDNRLHQRKERHQDKPGNNGQKRQFTGMHFWAPGYCVSTIGLDEASIRDYVKNQEKLETHKQAKLELPEFE